MQGSENSDKRVERNRRRREQYNSVTDDVRIERNRKRSEQRRQRKEGILYKYSDSLANSEDPFKVLIVALCG